MFYVNCAHPTSVWPHQTYSECPWTPCDLHQSSQVSFFSTCSSIWIGSATHASVNETTSNDCMTSGIESSRRLRQEKASGVCAFPCARSYDVVHPNDCNCHSYGVVDPNDCDYHSCDVVDPSGCDFCRCYGDDVASCSWSESVVDVLTSDVVYAYGSASVNRIDSFHVSEI